MCKLRMARVTSSGYKVRGFVNTAPAIAAHLAITWQISYHVVTSRSRGDQATTSPFPTRDIISRKRTTGRGHERDEAAGEMR